MKNLNLTIVSKKLANLTEEYGEKYPKFKKVQLEYIKQYDRLLMESQSVFGNQPSREAYARQEAEKLPIFEEFFNLDVEINVLNIQMRNLLQISKNLISGNWTGGGEYNGQ